MSVVTCEKCGAKNRVDERVTIIGKEPVCGRCGAKLQGGGGAQYASSDSASSGATHSSNQQEDESKPKTVTDATFARDVIAASNARPVLLDCWAPWCGPCRMVAPVLDALAAESAGLYRIAKLNVDENPRTSASLGIHSIPTLFIYKNGKLVERLVGAQPKQVIAARLAAHL